MNLFKMSDSVHDFKVFNKELYIVSNGLYHHNNISLKPVYTYEGDQEYGGFLPIADEIIFYAASDEGGDSYHYLDGKKAQLTENQKSEKMAGCAYVYSTDDRTGTLTSDVNGRTLIIDKPGSIDESSNLIFSRSKLDKLVQCFSSDLIKVWDRKFDSFNDKRYVGSCGQAYFTDKAYIYYQGTKDDLKEVIALSKGDGETLWQYSTHDVITCISQYQDVICLMVGGNLVQLNSDTGEVVSELPSGFVIEKFQAFVRDESYLYATCHVSKEVRIFDANSQILLHTVNIPKPFTTSRLQLPVCYHDGLLINLHSFLPNQVFTTYGVLHINKSEISNSKPITLTGEREPSHNIECLSDDSGEEFYQIMLEESDMDLVERYTEVYVADIASKYARQAYPAETVNKKFGGKIIVSINKGVIENPSEERLDESIKRLKILLTNFWPGAKNGKVNLDISWRWT
jgi:hypothetical protein